MKDQPFKNFTLGMFRQWFAENDQETYTKVELWDMFNQASPLIPPHLFPQQDIQEKCPHGACQNECYVLNCANFKFKQDTQSYSEQSKIVITPSGRIDYCVDCDAEHGYDCPKDEEKKKCGCKLGYYCEFCYKELHDNLLETHSESFKEDTHDWEEEFDKLIKQTMIFKLENFATKDEKDIKAFISQIEASAYQRG